MAESRDLSKPHRLRAPIVALVFVAAVSCEARERNFHTVSNSSSPDSTTEAPDGSEDEQDSDAMGSGMPNATSQDEPGAPAPEPESSAMPEPDAATNGAPVDPAIEPSTDTPDAPGMEPEPSDMEPEPSAMDPEPSAMEPEPSATEPEPSAMEPEPEPDPDPDPTEPEPIGGCDNQLLRNGSFDLGTTNWATSSTYPGIDVIVSFDDPDLQPYGVAPRSGSHLAWLGGIPSNEFDGHIVNIEQRLTLPADAARLTISGYVWIQTQEDEPGVAYDFTFIDLTSSSDRSVLWHPHAFSNLDASSGWVPFTFTLDSAGFVPRDVYLEIHSETDPNLMTSFWLDDLKLVAECGR